jgi:hypothetical protein
MADDNRQYIYLRTLVKMVQFQTNMKKMNDKSDFSAGDRLLYEQGYYKFSKKNSKGNFIGWDKESWTRTGEFIEVDNPEEFIKMDDRFDNKDFIKHHNFVIIKKENMSSIENYVSDKELREMYNSLSKEQLVELLVKKFRELDKIKR